MTTSTLQQEAFRRLGFGIGETMEIAQRLYEGVDLGGETAGLITYMRTDSTAMAKTAVARARSPANASATPTSRRSRGSTGRGTARGERRGSSGRRTRRSGRPTSRGRRTGSRGRLDRAAVQLYGLIWNRALASQMAAARFDRVRVEIAPEGTETGGIGLAAGGSKMVFDGHLRVWCGDSGQDAEGDGSVLPALAEREPVECAQNN